MAMQPFWSTTEIAEGETRHWQLGPLEFWVRRLPGEWQVTHHCEEEETLDDRWTLAAPAEFPEDRELRRFAFDSVGSDDQLTLKPEFPDRSIVSRPQIKLEIPPGARASFVCGIPLYVKLLGGTLETPSPLMTLPARILSRTWFGRPQEGESCYAATTRATRDYRQLPPHGFRVLCPVLIKNNTQKPLPFERICIRVKHLALFQGQDYLWSNEIRIVKPNVNDESRVVYGKGAPTIEPSADLVLPPREVISTRSVVARTFNNLRQIMEIQ